MDDDISILRNRCLLRVSGDDADSFLNGQLTVAIPGAPRRARLAAWCDAKGRAIALFRSFPLAQDDWLLSFPADLADTVAKRLRMFVLRSDVQISDASGEYAHCAAAQSGAGENDIAPVLELPVEGGWSEWLLPADTQAEYRDATLSLIRAGIPEIFVETSGKWVPQWLNLDQLDAIDFDKGCYPGQEVIAKLRYRGAVKRRMQRITDPGDDQEVVISARSEPEKEEALVVARV